MESGDSRQYQRRLLGGNRDANNIRKLHEQWTVTCTKLCSTLYTPESPRDYYRYFHFASTLMNVSNK